MAQNKEVLQIVLIPTQYLVYQLAVPIKHLSVEHVEQDCKFLIIALSFIEILEHLPFTYGQQNKFYHTVMLKKAEDKF